MFVRGNPSGICRKCTVALYNWPNVVYFCPFSFFRMDLLVFFMVCGVALFGSCTSGNAEWPPAAYKRIVECIPTGKPPTPSPPLNVAFCLALKVLRNILHTL